jgi:malate synthase
VLESAVTTIQNCDDSVAAVAAEDKIRVYRNWLGLMTGTLRASFRKGTQRIERSLAHDRELHSPRGIDGGTPIRS